MRAFAARQEWKLLGLILVAAAIFRLLGNGEMAPFSDESGHRLLVHPIDPHFFEIGKVLGQVIYSPIAPYGLTAMRTLIGVFGVLTVLGVFLTARLLAGSVAGLTGAALWALLPMAVFHDRMALHDPMISLFHIWSVWAMTWAVRRRCVGMAAAAGVLTGLGAMVKFPMGILAVSCLAVAYVSVSREQRRERWWLAFVFLGAAAAPFATLLPYRHLLMQSSGQFFGGAPWRHNLALVYGWLADYNTALFPVTAAACAGLAVWRRSAKRIVLALLFLVPVLGMAGAMQVFFARYVLAYLLALVLLLAVSAAGSGRAERVLLVVLGCLGAAWLRADVTIVRDPAQASLPADDYRQYIAGWPSGAGVRETMAFLRREAAAGGKPVLVSVGGFGRHGSWTIAPALAGETGLRFRVGFIETEADVRDLAMAARTHRVLVLEEPPAYEIAEPVRALFRPAPAVVFRHVRELPRLGTTDGELRILRLHEATAVTVSRPEGAPVADGEEPAVEEISNPNGMEQVGGKRFFWMGDRATTLVVRAGKPGVIAIEATFQRGPSAAEGSGNGLVAVTSEGFEGQFPLAGGPGRVEIPVGPGRTRIALFPLAHGNGKRLANGDGRTLLLGVTELRVGPATAPATSRR